MLYFTIVDPLVKLLNWEWLGNLTIGSIIIRLIITILFCGFIGAERAVKRHAAGLRTYVLVGVGAAVAMMTNEYLIEVGYGVDGARLGAQVISGIGFLGAGTILVTSRNQIRGLTTAAGLWACACMGLAIGAGFFTLALLGAFIIILALIFFPKIERIFELHSTVYDLHVELDSRPNLKEFITFLRKNEIKVFSLEHNAAYSESGLSVYTITIGLTKSAKKSFKNGKILIEEIFRLPYVNFVEIM